MFAVESRGHGDAKPIVLATTKVSNNFGAVQAAASADYLPQP
jgi:hypothetical protein